MHNFCIKEMRQAAPRETYFVVQDTSDWLHNGPLLYSPGCTGRQQSCVQEIAAAAHHTCIRGLMQPPFALFALKF